MLRRTNVQIEIERRTQHSTKKRARGMKMKKGGGERWWRLLQEREGDSISR